ncbi:MAG: hypothetical protein ISR69_10160 [Gammaproteobacteria bacterium]|nr:hypothetical protein [Gammaproteobacteria bacterium]
MKPVYVLTLLSLIFSSPVIFANELTDFDNETLVYCKQEAISLGIEDDEEKTHYIQYCAANFGVTFSEEDNPN